MLRRRIFDWAILLLVAAVFDSVAVAQSPVPPAAAKINPAVITILAYDKGGEFLRQGSGFIFNQQGAIIGPLHILHGASRVDVKTSTGKVYPLAGIGAEDREADLFAGSIGAEAALAGVRIKGSAPRAGEKVFVVGLPAGVQQPFTEGVIKAFDEIPSFGRILEITAAVPETLSGAPVVDEEGDLVGVALLQVVQGANRYFALPAGRLARLRDRRVRPATHLGGQARPWAESPAGLLYTGLDYVLLGKYAEALPYFERCLTVNREQVEARFYTGYCDSKLNQWQAAADAFKEVIQAKPNDMPALEGLGQALGNLNKWADALEVYKQAAALQPNSPWPYLGLATAYGNLSQFDNELEAAKHVIQINPNLYRGH
ncbi:MAG TPA: trypsin-like peptidase domain-containing protein, partial [Blastocatellia bacterium]|nr:trypsin-like peptidase domain-containing protein [Blastocatellia bacterium]